MLKQFYYILFTSFLVTQFVFGDLGVLKEYDSLITHYQQHKKCFNDSFYNFVDKHYGTQLTQHASMHHDKNHKIPFSTHTVDIHYFVVHNFYLPSLNNVLLLYKEHKSFYSSNCRKWLLSTSILQPPRV